MEKSKTTVLPLLLLYLVLGSWAAVEDTSESIGDHSKEPSNDGRLASCTPWPKGVTVRDAYLALSPISARYETMALLLNIDRGVLGNIEKDCHRDNDCNYRRTIEAWYYGRVDPSWNELLSVLENMGEKKLARNVRIKYLCLIQSAKVLPKANTSVTLNYGSPAETMNYLVNKFEEMVNLFEDYLVQNIPDLDIFKHRVLHILHPPTAMNINGEYFAPQGFMEDIINEADSVGKIIAYFHTHIMCNFFEYEIFHSLVAKFGTKELQERLENYKTQVSEFLRDTSLSEFFQLRSKDNEPPEGFVAYTIKFEGSPDNVTLEQLRQLRKDQAKKYSLPSYAFRFASGSFDGRFISIAWFVSSLVVQKIVQTDLSTHGIWEFMPRNEDVIYLKVGNNVVFDDFLRTLKLSVLLDLCLPVTIGQAVFLLRVLYTRKKCTSYWVGANFITVFLFVANYLFELKTTDKADSLIYVGPGVILAPYIGSLLGIAFSVVTAKAVCECLRRVYETRLQFNIKGIHIHAKKGIMVMVGAILGSLTDTELINVAMFPPIIIVLIIEITQKILLPVLLLVIVVILVVNLTIACMMNIKSNLLHYKKS